MDKQDAYVRPLNSLSKGDTALVGGKNASLGEMLQHLGKLAVRVPQGFAITTKAYDAFLQHNQLTVKITKALAQYDVTNVKQLRSVSQKIQKWIVNGQLPKTISDEVMQHYAAMGLRRGQSLAVRSSATAEDAPTTSFAGLQMTYLNVKGKPQLLLAIKKVFASLFTERSIAYRVHNNIVHEDVKISVGVQQMVRSDKAASGVMFTIDTESLFDQVILITGSYGLGETIVQGEVNPDEFYVHKANLNSKYQAILSRKLGNKQLQMVYGNTNEKVKLTTVPKSLQAKFCLKDHEILELATAALKIEQHYQLPMDIEWAKDGLDGKLYIVQARPETVKAQHQAVYERYQLKNIHKLPKALTTGRSIGQKIGQGRARLITSPQDMHLIKPGEVLVTDITNPDWEPIMKQAAAIVTNRGGRTCHAAIVSRELGIPAVVGCENATNRITDGMDVTVSCAQGESGFVYKGLLPFTVQRQPVQSLPKLPVQISMNIANPEQAFMQQFIPNQGVGLARLEFIIGNLIGIHPQAILQFNELPKGLQKSIKKHTSAYENPHEFYIEKLAEGIATISAAFYPKPVIVRFSDFKSNEYANLVGGDIFEPAEENPMLGYRGAGRYLSQHFEPSFELECQAIKRVREQKGLNNTMVMFPFVRTVDEAKKLIALAKKFGLQRNKNGLKIYMMCEIPSNAILADEFLKYFDGFSIGSNDLTQLTLGLDRDSALVAATFDERNPAVKHLLHLAIQACIKQKKYVGICGQGPSDYPDLAKWLCKEGITSMSLSPDSIVATWLELAKYLGV